MSPSSTTERQQDLDLAFLSDSLSSILATGRSWEVEAAQDAPPATSKQNSPPRQPYWSGGSVRPLVGRRRHFLHLDDLSADDLQGVLQTALDLKAGRARLRGEPDRRRRPMAGRSSVLLMTQPCMNTHISFETAFKFLGGDACVHLSPAELASNAGEELPDTIRKLSKVYDFIVVRVGGHANLIEAADCSSVPVINAGTDVNSPCQVMGDLVTILDHKRKLKGLRIAMLTADGPVLSSWQRVARKLLLHLVIICPHDRMPDRTTVNMARSGGAQIEVKHDLMAVVGADVIYSDGSALDVASMHALQVDEGLLQVAPDAVFLHSSPLRRGLSASDGALDSEQSLVFEQADGRLLAAKAILLYCSGLSSLWHPIRQSFEESLARPWSTGNAPDS